MLRFRASAVRLLLPGFLACQPLNIAKKTLALLEARGSETSHF
jgi:hypothetical protein